MARLTCLLRRASVACSIGLTMTACGEYSGSEQGSIGSEPGDTASETSPVYSDGKISPYLQLPGHDQITLRWESADPQVSRVYYGESPQNLSQATVSKSETTQHQVTITGLQAGTRYYYAIGDANGIIHGAGEPLHFDTLPSDAATVRAWVVGNAGHASTAQSEAVRDAYLSYSDRLDTDLLVMLGDNVADASDYTGLIARYREVASRAAVFPVPGEQESASGEATPHPAYLDAFTLPASGELGGYASGTEAYYAFDYNDIHFISLNSLAASIRDGEREADLDPAMLNWLRMDLLHYADKLWRVVLLHHGPYSRGDQDADTDPIARAIRNQLLPLLDEYDVDLVLTAQSQAYERSGLITGCYGEYYADCAGYDTSNGGASASPEAIARGQQLWQEQDCSTCHTLRDGKPHPEAADARKIRQAIAENRGGMGRYSGLSDAQVSDIAAYVASEYAQSKRIFRLKADEKGELSNPYRKTLDRQAQGGAIFMVAGSAGRSGGGRLNHPVMEVSLDEPGSVALEFTDNRLEVLFVNAAGDVRDHFAIAKDDDTRAPRLLRSKTTDDQNISLIMSEQVDPRSLPSPDTIQLSDSTGRPIAIHTVSLAANGRVLQLMTDPLPAQDRLDIHIDAIEDLYGNQASLSGQAIWYGEDQRPAIASLWQSEGCASCHDARSHTPAADPELIRAAIENNAGELMGQFSYLSEEQLRRIATEVGDLNGISYLAEDDESRGKFLWQTRNCGTCHDLEGFLPATDPDRILQAIEQDRGGMSRFNDLAFSDLEAIAVYSAGVNGVAVGSAGGSTPPAASPAPTPTPTSAPTPPPNASGPSETNGRQLWSSEGCSNCHVAGDFPAAADTRRIRQAINDNRGGMGRFAYLSDMQLADIAAYIASSDTGGTPPPGARNRSWTLQNNAAVLRKAALLLAGRLPSDEERQAVASEEGLRSVLRTLMQEDHFGDFVSETTKLWLLTAGADLGNIEDSFFGLTRGQDDVSDDRNGFLLIEARKDKIRREPLELARYIAMNDRPWSDMLTADFSIVADDILANVYRGDSVAVSGQVRPGWQAARYGEAGRTQSGQAYPHAGVLSTPAWLSRFPTTATNRNRHRVNTLFYQFLGVDIEAFGTRPNADTQDGTGYRVPTMEDPVCTACHSFMDPVAGTFMDFGAGSNFREDITDALDNTYKSSAYPKDHNGESWYSPGDRWYRDVFAPGYGARRMPGAYFGFSAPDPQSRVLPRDTWNVVDQPEYNGRNDLSKAFDDNPETIYHSAFRDGDVPMPHRFTVDMGATFMMNGLRYLPRQRLSAQWHIHDYRLEVSRDGLIWTEVSAGTMRGRTLSPTEINFPARRARYFRLTAFSQTPQTDRRNLTVIAELHALKEAPVEAVPDQEFANGGDSALQWMARELVADPRFIKGSLRFWYRGLFGREALWPPQDPNAPGHAQALAAFQLQEAEFDAIAERLKGRAPSVRDILVELILSEAFRAEFVAAGTSPQDEEQLAEVGMTRLLSSAEMNRKFRALLGVPLFPDLESFSALAFGAFDGGMDLSTPNAAVTTMILSAYEFSMLHALCNEAIAVEEFKRPASERRLFPHVDIKDYPGRPLRTETVLMEVFTDIPGGLVDSIRGAGRPQETAELLTLESPYTGDEYGQRISTLLIPPTSGEYQFWIAGDNRAELWLSSDEDPLNTRLIAQVPNWTRPHEWEKYPEQTSSRIALQGGRAYYLKILHKENAGGDHVAVAWSGPGISREVVGSSTPDVFRAPPDSPSEPRLRENLRHLHAYLLNEELPLNSPEIDATLALFSEVQAMRFDDSGLGNNEGVGQVCEGSAYLRIPDRNDYRVNRRDTHPDANGTLRAWNAVLAYLLGDISMLHE